MTTYRCLNVGEIISFGDEWNDAEWRKFTYSIGEEYTQTDFDDGLRIKRPLDPLLLSVAQGLFENFVYRNNAFTPEQKQALENWDRLMESLL